VFGIRDLRLSLFGLIVSHIQLLIGLILYFISPKFQWWGEGMGAVMKNSTYRLYLVEHPVTNILAIVLITMGWSMHKRQVNNNKKFVRIALFYTLGLLLLLSRVPWEAWP
jgi:NADH:ubiquinone oxidoreductase subunit 2 (subunit N)